MNYDFLKDRQAEIWIAHIKRDPLPRHPAGVSLVESTVMGLMVGAIVICIYLAVHGA